jgi:tetratricopeptide (TPR) repeat protein
MMIRKTNEDQAGPPLDRSLLQPTPAADATECPICLERPPREPVTLKQCQHTYCTVCLVEWQQQLRRAKVGARPPFPCPMCRQDVEDVEQSMMEHAALLAGEANMRKSLDDVARRSLRQEALDCLDRLLMAPNASVQAYVYKAQILVDMDMGREAIRCIDDLLIENEKRMNHPLLRLIQQQEEAEARGDYDESDRLAEESVQYYNDHGTAPTRLHPQSMFGVYTLKSRACEVVEEWEGALRANDKAFLLLKQPDDAPAVELRKLFMGTARCAYMAKQYEKSIASSEMAIEMNRHFDGVHKYMALSLKELGKLDEAIDTMNRAVLYEAPWKPEIGRQALQLYRELVAERDAAQN